MGYIQEKSRYQVTLMPKSIEDYVGEDNPVRVIHAFVEVLDLREANFQNTTPAKEGRPRYSPKTLLKLYIYGYLYRIRSSRKLMEECLRNVHVMWLIGELTPDFRTISDFRKNNKKALKNIFKEFVKICLELNLYSRQLLAIDGSKFRAVNSKMNNVTENKLKKHLKRIAKKIDAYVKELEENDSKDSESRKYTKEELLSKIEHLKKQTKKYNNYLKKMQEVEETQISFTDHESRLMLLHNGGYDVGYNVQTAVDEENKMIADFMVTNHCNDSNLLSKVAKEAKETLEVEVIEVVADNGYESAEDTLECLKAGILPNVSLKEGIIEQEVTLDYTESEITPEIKNSTKPEDIEKCLKAGVLSTIYQDKNIEIEIVEEEKIGSSNKCFVLSDDGKYVVCPEGKKLNKVSYLKKRRKTRFVSRSACSSCKNKCTESKFKQVDLKYGQTKLFINDPNYKEKKVLIRIKPDKEKLKQRKCIVEHPFGTIKRGWGFSYMLLQGIAKCEADFSLAFLAYNIRRAINIVGVEELVAAIMKR